MTLNTLSSRMFNFQKLNTVSECTMCLTIMYLAATAKTVCSKKNAKRLFALILSCFLVVYGFLLYHSEEPIYNGEMILLGWRLIVSG